MTRVKICGLTREADVRAACAAGADALGFVMVSGTKRNVSPQRVRELVRVAHPFVLTVGVVQDLEPEEAIALAESSGVRALQLHGSESVDVLRAIRRLRPGLTLFKALQVREPSDLRNLDAWSDADGLLLDSGAGSGRPFDWSWLSAATRPETSLMVAGGLDPTNVSELLQRIRPDAVDVSSGVEGAPGQKDPERIRSFVGMVKQNRGFSACDAGV